MAASTYDILVEQGTTYTLRIRPSSPTLDFTGSTTRGQIRKTYSDPTILASFTCNSGSDVDGFYVDIQLTPAQTSALPVPPASNYKKKEALYCYDVECQLSSGLVLRLLQGKVDVSPEVTK